MVHRHALSSMPSTTRVERLRMGDLVWDAVVAIEPIGDRECFDARFSHKILGLIGIRQKLLTRQLADGAVAVFLLPFTVFE